MCRFFNVFILILALIFTCSTKSYAESTVPRINDEDLDILVVVVHGVAFDKTEPTLQTIAATWKILYRNGFFTTKQASYVAEEFIIAISGVITHSIYFLQDALATLKAGKAIHSEERRLCEFELLERGDISSEFAQRAFDTIENIAQKKLVVVPELGPMTKTNIEFLLDSLFTANERIRELFTLKTKSI